jgi:hypothetical protein
MSDDLRQQIHANLDLKETEDLRELWQTNDRVEYTETAFDVLREILLERLGELPPQAEPVLEHLESEPVDESDEAECWGKFTGRQNNPAFYEPRQVLWLVKWLNRAAIGLIFATVLPSLLEMPRVQRSVLALFMGNVEWNLVAWLITLVVFAFAMALQSIVLYFSLNALGTILKILMEMEFNSHPVT